MLKLDWNLLFTAINIVIWYIAIKRFLLKPINNVIDKRNEANNSKFNEAEAAKKDAYALKAKYETSLAGANAEYDEIVAAAREDAKKEYDRIIAEAETKSENMINRAKEQAKEEHKRVMREGDAEMARLIMEAATKITLANTNDESNKHIYDEFISEEGEARES